MLFISAVTASIIFCCCHGNVRFFPKEMFNFSWYESMRDSWHLSGKELVSNRHPLTCFSPSLHYSQSSHCSALNNLSSAAWLNAKKKVDFPNLIESQKTAQSTYSLYIRENWIKRQSKTLEKRSRKEQKCYAM